MSSEDKHPQFKYFRYVETAKTEPVIRKANTNGIQKYEKKIVDRIYFEPQDVFSFNLENITPAVSIDDGGGYTQYHNYLWLWTQFIGGMPILTYMAIRKYLFDYIDRKGSPEEFIAFPPLDEIARRVGVKSRNTLNSYFDVLENYGFLYRFWKAVDIYDDYGKFNGSKDVGVVFVVRKKIPLLPEELVAKLTKEDKEFHYKIKSMLGKSGFFISCENEYKYEYKKHLKELIEKGVFRLSNESKKNTYVFIENGEIVTKLKEDVHRDIKLQGISKEDKEFWNDVLEQLSKRISKPSFETWLQKTLAYRLSDSHIIITVTNDFAKDWIKKHYLKIITSVLQEEFEITFEEIDIIVINQQEEMDT